MTRPSATASDRQPDALTLAAGTWLACGTVLYGLTPLPLHDGTLGWSAAFWLLAAPFLLLVARRLLVPRCMSRPAYRKPSPNRRASVQAQRRPATATILQRRERIRTRRLAA